MNELIEILNWLWSWGSFQRIRIPGTMIPNILQLAGTILTLLTALLSAMGLFGNIREIIYDKFNSSKEKDVLDKDKKETVSLTLSLIESVREVTYGLGGIVLIIIGFTASTLDLDYKDSCIFYIFLPLILLILCFFTLVYSFLKTLIIHKKFLKKRLKSTLVFGISLIIIFGGIYFSETLAVSFAFISSTILLIILSLIILESKINAIIINKIYKKLKEKVLKHLDLTIDETNKLLQSNTNVLMKLHLLLESIEAQAPIKDKDRGKKDENE
ncbi:hypothetical protein ABE178_25590 [Priestia megaterium]